MEQAVTQALSRNGLLSAVTDQENADLLSNLHGAFGAVTLAQILSEKRPLRPVILDNVAPSLPNLASGAYPFFKTFYVVSGPASSAEAKQFLDYLVSPAGRKILGNYGHLAPEKER
jgi:phosphate transport system substrate-binding protein